MGDFSYSRSVVSHSAPASNVVRFSKQDPFAGVPDELKEQVQELVEAMKEAAKEAAGKALDEKLQEQEVNPEKPLGRAIKDYAEKAYAATVAAELAKGQERS